MNISQQLFQRNEFFAQYGTELQTALLRSGQLSAYALGVIDRNEKLGYRSMEALGLADFVEDVIRTQGMSMYWYYIYGLLTYETSLQLYFYCLSQPYQKRYRAMAVFYYLSYKLPAPPAFKVFVERRFQDRMSPFNSEIYIKKFTEILNEHDEKFGRF